MQEKYVQATAGEWNQSAAAAISSTSGVKLICGIMMICVSQTYLFGRD